LTTTAGITGLVLSLRPRRVKGNERKGIQEHTRLLEIQTNADEPKNNEDQQPVSLHLKKESARARGEGWALYSKDTTHKPHFLRCCFFHQEEAAATAGGRTIMTGILESCTAASVTLPTNTLREREREKKKKISKRSSTKTGFAPLTSGCC